MRWTWWNGWKFADDRHRCLAGPAGRRERLFGESRPLRPDVCNQDIVLGLVKSTGEFAAAQLETFQPFLEFGLIGRSGKGIDLHGEDVDFAVEASERRLVRVGGFVAVVRDSSRGFSGRVGSLVARGFRGGAFTGPSRESVVFGLQ